MLKIRSFALAVVVCLVAAIVGFESASAADQEFTPEKIIAEHLKSIGKPEALSGIKSRVLTGVSSVEFVQGARGNQNGGQFLIASDGSRLGMVMKYGSIDYPGEYFAYDGTEVTVGYISPG